MIAVDTSVWVASLRARGEEAKVLAALLDADQVLLPLPVRIELLSGARSSDRSRLRRALSALPVAYPTDETWTCIDAWIERAAPGGERFGLGDLLIAAVASESGALIWSLDKDFVRMERAGLISLYQP